MLALAERHDLAGADVIRAYEAGVEVAHRVAELTMPDVSQNGWHTTSTFGAPGAAAGACALLGLDRSITINALGLALSKSGGIRGNFGTQCKPYHAGMAARSGLEAVSLAQSGITASATAVEGLDGFIQCFAGTANCTDFSNRTEAKLFSGPFDLRRHGLAFKDYPCCSGAHPACDLILDLLAERHLVHDEIDSIEVGTSQLSKQELVLRPTDNYAFRATQMIRGKAQPAGNGWPLPRDATQYRIIWVAPYGRVVKRLSALLRLLAREWPLPAKRA